MSKCVDTQGTVWKRPNILTWEKKRQAQSKSITHTIETILFIFLSFHKQNGKPSNFSIAYGRTFVNILIFCKKVRTASKAPLREGGAERMRGGGSTRKQGFSFSTVDACSFRHFAVAKCHLPPRGRQRMDTVTKEARRSTAMSLAKKSHQSHKKVITKMLVMTFLLQWFITTACSFSFLPPVSLYNTQWLRPDRKSVV